MAAESGNCGQPAGSEGALRQSGCPKATFATAAAVYSPALAMSFASPLFLWYFMPAVLAAVLLAPRSWRNGIIVVASLVFYAVGAGATTLLLGAIVVNYLVGPSLEPDEWNLMPVRRRRLLIGVITFDVAVLVIWKYAGFASEQAAALAGFTGMDLPVVELALPIGISFLHLPQHLLRGGHLPRRAAGAAQPGLVRHVHLDVPAARRRADRALPGDRRPAPAATHPPARRRRGRLAALRARPDQEGGNRRLVGAGRMSRFPWNFGGGPMVIRRR